MALSMSFSAPGSSNQGQHSDTWNGAGPAIETVDYTTWREQLPTPEGTPSYGNSPENGPVAAEQRTEGGLSFPVAPGALQSQLEAWSTLSLDPGVGRWHPTTGADGWTRFRVKKKEREKQFEEERVQLREKVADLEKEVSTLKHENAWLRELILEKARPVGDKGDETPMPKAND
ncbi:hypothetical protein RQP46_001835 [Phenoliferia psychrophenolica]